MTPIKMWRSWRKVLKKHRDKCPSSTHRYNVDHEKIVQVCNACTNEWSLKLYLNND